VIRYIRQRRPSTSSLAVGRRGRMATEASTQSIDVLALVVFLPCE
jgi:hypothetical protein